MTLERKTRLRADPDKTRAWQRRSRKLLPRRSKTRIREAPQRAAVVEEVKLRDGGCSARGRAPGLCSGPIDVDEVIPRGRWARGYLDPNNCQALCRAHHDWKHAHPEEATQLGLTKSRRTT